MKPTMVTRTIGAMIVLRENTETPLDQEWDAFLKLLVENKTRFPNLKVLVVTDGGGPNAAQRKRLEATLGGRSISVAVVTDSAKSRFIASMISFINRDHRGFGTREIAQAYEHLKLSTQERIEAEAALKEMGPQIR
jgi:hypothetical protein